MQVASHEVVDVVSVRHRVVAAAGAVRVACGVPGALVRWGAVRRLRCADLEHALVDVPVVAMVEVAVV